MSLLTTENEEAFSNIFGAHCEKYAKGIEDCKSNKGKQSNDPEYLKGYVHQIKIESQQAHKGIK